ncbi:MAG: glycosyltransferase family 2 protein [Alphaproteobacteria bacterium]|nr:glycosyltransferase family 2 protein [Alphaproteobacteria bacterium]
MPKVSIVLPVYNGERFLEQSLDSILNQTFSDWELVIVNDCSKDKTPKIADQYAQKDGRIRVIHNKVNKKLPASLNVGFAQTTGEYLTWTSDDNIAKTNWLDTLVKYLDEHPNADMVSASMERINEDGSIFDLPPAKDDRKVIDLAYRCNVGAAFMYRRSIADIVGEYDTNTFCAEDYDYWCRIALAGELHYLADNIYSYRINSASLTATQQPRILQKKSDIQKKYRTAFIDKFNMGYIKRAILSYLSVERKWSPMFIVFDTYKFILRQATNILLFWNTTLRKRVFQSLTIKL